MVALPIKNCIFSFLNILPRVSARYIILTFSRRYTNFFRNENSKNICENFSSSICWLRLKILFLWKWIATFSHILPRVFAHYYDIFAYFTSNICSLLRHFCKFYLEYLLITADFCKFYLEYLLITSSFFHILPRISANYFYYDIFANFILNICSSH